MVTAIRQVHGKNGPWLSDGGYEYNAVLLAALFEIVEHGPGPLSVDAARGSERSGLLWALGALALGVAGSYAAAPAPARRPVEAPAEEEIVIEATPREELDATPAAVDAQ
jgi:putative oxidoreductase